MRKECLQLKIETFEYIYFFLYYNNMHGGRARVHEQLPIYCWQLLYIQV